MISSNSKALNTLQITKNLKFPEKLFFILEFIDLYAPHLKSTFSWKQHGRCFYISDKKSFERNIMNLFFNSAKYDTFRRQLNIWGFARITKVRSPDIGCYFHEKFLRSKFDLCNTMIRSRASELMKFPGNQPDFERMPIMPSTAATLSIPQFTTAMATNLSFAICHHDEKFSSCLLDCKRQNTVLSTEQDEFSANNLSIENKKRKQADFQSENKSQQMHSSFESVYPVQTMVLPTISPSMLIGSSSKDTCKEYSDGQNTFSNQEVFQAKKKKKKVTEQVSIDHSLPVSNGILNSHTFKKAIASSNGDLMIPTMDVMPIEQSFALAQMFLQQQQANNFNSSMNMIPNATTFTCPSSKEVINIQDAKTEWNLSSSNQATTMPTNGSNVSLSTACLSLSMMEKSLRLSEELSSCDSMNDLLSSFTDLKEMNSLLLDKKNQTWL